MTVEEVLSAARQWWDGLAPALREEYVSQIGQEVPQRLQTMLTRWRDFWEQDRKGEQVLAVEMYWRRALRTPSGSTTTLFGFIDEVYLDTARNLVVVRDIKTSRNSLDTQTTADDMMDSQLHLYAWGASPAIEAWEQGKVRALSYDRIRSGAPLSPEVTVSGNLSKAVTGYDLETYLEWAKGPSGEGVPWGKDGEYFKTGKRAGEAKFGHYQAEESVIERLSTPAARSAWYQRTLTPLNVHLVREHLRSAMDTTEDSQRTRKRFEETGSAARNLSKNNCRWCDFAKLCRAEMIGGPRGDYPLEDYGLQVKPERRKKA